MVGPIHSESHSKSQSSSTKLNMHNMANVRQSWHNNQSECLLVGEERDPCEHS